MAYNNPRLERVFIQTQSALRTITNAAGTWTNTGAKILRVTPNGLKMSPNMPKTPVPWKTGTRSTQPGILGRKSSTWSISGLPVIPSGTAGTAPDMDVLMTGLMGVSTNSPGVKQSYTFSDTVYAPFALFSFAHGVATLANRVQYGCTVQEANFTLNGNVFEMGASGLGVYQLDSDFFASEPDLAKAGLTVFPAEPVGPATVGTIIPGFGGVATFDSTAMDTTTCPLRNSSIRVRTGNTLIGDTFQDAYGAIQVGGERMVTLTCGFVDNDAAALINLKNKAKANTTLDITLQVGTTAGLIVKFIMKSFTLSLPEYSETNAWIDTTFSESQAHASAIGNIDDLVVEFS
jgi:hypothetical protein